MGFGKNLAKLRKEQKLSQLELAEAVEVSRQAISKWEVGASLPSTEKMLALAKVLHVSVDELVGESNKHKKASQAALDKWESAGRSRAVPYVRLGRVIAAVCAAALLIAAAVVGFSRNTNEDGRDVVPMEELEHREIDPPSSDRVFLD